MAPDELVDALADPETVLLACAGPEVMKVGQVRDGSGGPEGPTVGTTQEPVPVIVVVCALAAMMRVAAVMEMVKYIMTTMWVIVEVRE